MYRKSFLFLGLFAALAVNSIAQSNKYQNPTAIKLSSGSDTFDPLGILEGDDEKTSGVRASVVVNMGRVERAAFDMVNRKRAEKGLQLLEWSDEIAAIARVHSRNMAEFRFFSHRGLDSKLVSDRADDQGVEKWRAIGENIAFNRGYKDPMTKAVELWLDSPSHKRNLLDCNWRESAVGVAVAEDGSYYFTQVFLARK